MAPQSKLRSNSTKPATPRVGKEKSIDWPPLYPLLRSTSLAPTTVLEHQILLIRKLFTEKLCRTYITFLANLPLSTTPGKPKRGEAIRVNDRFQVEDGTFAERLWKTTALQELISSPESDAWGGEPLGLNSNIRVYRYRPGQFFDRHYDESNRLSFGEDKIPARTTWTLLIYLSTCEGGETVFHPESSGRKGEISPDPIVIDLEAGTALLHRHGEDCILHEGREVRKGEKWVLRSDLVVRR